MSKYIRVYKPVNFNSYLDCDCVPLMLPFDESVMCLGADICLQYSFCSHKYLKIVAIKTMYGSSINDFISRAVYGLDKSTFLDILAQEYFSKSDKPLASVLECKWAFIYAVTL